MAFKLKQGRESKRANLKELCNVVEKEDKHWVYCTTDRIENMSSKLHNTAVSYAMKIVQYLYL